MKKTGKIWLITAAVLTVVGLLSFVLIMTVRGWDFISLRTETFETNTYTLSESFDQISVDVDTSEISFVPAEDTACSVVCTETEKLKHSVSVQNGTLIIEMTDTRKWYDHIGIFWGTYKVTVYLPKTEYASLMIKTHTGDVAVPKDFIFEALTIDGDTADVDCFASVSGTASIRSNTGDICMDTITAEHLALSSDTGKVQLDSVTVTGDIQVETDTGKIFLTAASCANLKADSDTGDMRLKNVTAEGSFSIANQTGDVEFTDSDAAEIYVETDTGDVTGTLRSQKIFQTESETGDIRVPDSLTGGRCKITTDTGDIKLQIAS